MGFLARLLVGLFMAFLPLVGPAAAQRGPDIPALLSGEVDPEGFDLVGLRFDNGELEFGRLKTLVNQHFGMRQGADASAPSRETDLALFALDVRLAAWLDLVGECSDRSTCDRRVADVRKRLQAFRVLRDRLARGELADGDEGLLFEVPVIERALAVDPTAQELLARSIHERLAPPEELKLLLTYEQSFFLRSNSEWLQSTLARQGWLHFSGEQLGLPPDAQRAPAATRVLGRMVPQVAQSIPQQVDMALWMMFRNIPDTGFKRRMLAQALPFVQRGQSSNLFFSTMTDRLAAEADEPQVYGTEFRCGAAKVLEYYPLADASHVNARREAIGLQSLETDSRERRQLGEPCMN
jgi:uncharacterized protein DUF6624